MLEQTSIYITENEIIKESQIGGIPGLSPIQAINQIYTKTKTIQNTKQTKYFHKSRPNWSIHDDKPQNNIIHIT